MALDMTTFDAALKQHYVPMTVNNLVYKDNPFMAVVSKNEKFGGRNMPVPLLYGNPQGRSATFSNALAQKTNSKVTAFTITRAHDYSLANIDNETIEASQGDSDAFMEAATTEIDGAFNAATRSLAGAIFRNGTGSIGKIGSISTDTITLSDINTVVNFEVGMTLQVSATDGATLRSGTIQLIGVDRDLGTLKASGAITSGIAAAVAGDYILVAGDFNAKVSGVDAWLPMPGTITSAAFFGVDRTVDKTRLGGVSLDKSGVPIEEALIDGAARVGREGGRPDKCWIDHSNFANLEKALGSKVQYVDVKSDVGIGFQGIRVMGPKGPIDVLADQNMHSDRAYMLQMNTWKLHSLGMAPKLLESDGMKFLRVSSADAVEVRVGYYAQLACYAPGWNAVIKLA